ncbi:MAG: glycosyltransferase family 4 protein [Fimbriimonadales bacterium]
MSYHLPITDAIAHTGYRVSLVVPDRPIACLQKTQVVRYPVPKRWLSKLATYLNPLWARQRFLTVKNLNPDIVHLMNSEGNPSAVLWARWIRRELGCPFVVSVHDPEPHPGSWIAWVNYKLGHSVVRSATCVHIFSDCFVSFLTQQGVSQEKIHVIPLASDITPFTQHKREGVQRENMVLFFGRLEAYKGLNFLIEAAYLLRDEMRFVIAGPGKLPPKLKNEMMSAPNLIELRNYRLDESEVAELFMRAAVCVMPYIQSTQSAIPWIAAAFGVPVVATDSGGIASQVRQMNGVVVPPRNPQALADGIRQARGRAVIWPQEWDIQKIAKQYDDMYKMILNAEV